MAKVKVKVMDLAKVKAAGKAKARVMEKVKGQTTGKVTMATEQWTVEIMEKKIQLKVLQRLQQKKILQCSIQQLVQL
jgi:hypothetical protein